MKLASIFFKASADHIRSLLQKYKQTSEKYEACFDIFQSECRPYSQFTANIHSLINSNK